MYFHPLNFIRFSLALGVILFHYGTAYYPFNEGWLNRLIINSSFRVSFFFFISGFVMSMVYARQADSLTPVHFYKRRFARIFPVYWLAFVATVLAVVFIKDAAPKGLNVILHGLGLQSLNPGHVLDLNYPTWSISVELIFYLVFPFLLRWMMRLSAKKLVLFGFLSWLLQSLQHILFVELLYNGTKVAEEFISTFPLWHLPTFLIGMFTARAIALNPFKEFFAKRAVFLVLTATGFLAYVIFFPNPFLKYIHNGLLSPVFALLVMGLYYDRSQLNRSLSHPKVSRLGDFSYGLFIFQYPLWLLTTKIAGENHIKSPWFFLIYLCCLFLLSDLVNRYFEKPFLKKLRGIH